MSRWPISINDDTRAGYGFASATPRHTGTPRCRRRKLHAVGRFTLRLRHRWRSFPTPHGLWHSQGVQRPPGLHQQSFARKRVYIQLLPPRPLWKAECAISPCRVRCRPAPFIFHVSISFTENSNHAVVSISPSARAGGLRKTIPVQSGPGGRACINGLWVQAGRDGKRNEPAAFRPAPVPHQKISRSPCCPPHRSGAGQKLFAYFSKCCSRPRGCFHLCHMPAQFGALKKSFLKEVSVAVFAGALCK